MYFRCPSCGFNGAVRIPTHLPKGRTVRIRCSRCQKPFPLSLGRLFPQEHPAGYQALVPDSLGCRGTKVGQLWVESIGPREDRTPVIVFPAHPSLPHDVMHDLMDTFGEYFRICYLEFPGTLRNQQDLGNRSYASVFIEHIELLKKHLGVSGFHLLAHLGSAALALDVAIRQPDPVTSVILIEPDFVLLDRTSARSTAVKLDSIIRELHRDGDHEKMLASLVQDVWDSKLPQPHTRGLAKILTPGFQPDNLKHDLVVSGSNLNYAKLSRQKTPVLILHAREGGDSARRDALYLQASLPSAVTGTVDKGGAWSAWFRPAAIAKRLLSFKRTSENKTGAPPRKRSQTLNGQPLGWMLLVFVLLAAGLSLASSWLRYQPESMSRVIPPLLAGLLPILWFVIPKKINPISFLRFRRFSVRTVLLPIAVGALLGLFFRSLLLTLGSIASPFTLPPALLSLDPGSRGRLLELAGIAVVSLFVLGVAENLWTLRRSRLLVLMPAALFSLLPPAFPDILWKLPAGFAAAVLFAASLSIYSPLFLLLGFAAASELPIPLDQLPIYWQSLQGVTVTVTLLAAAILLAVFSGTSGKPVPPDEMYLTETINKEGRMFTWATSVGIVLVVFSLIAAAALIFSFLAV